ncbi:hypothetical protein [Caenimonas aquaedulcis]|uniref:Uncharacterized protein n=1 Tax=Caenimonas aquaedulcis TaxID=2793270 RepID=A0A931H7D2_9BURK|nr:hypothetical protein [Caenimonas aquaedulcis]MBG9389951.1 hypothetical protein [Caenimonas aquaedulcis]
MASKPRLPIDPTTNLPSINSFGELSNFLRSAVADEDSRQLSESMGQLATHVEAIIARLRLNRNRTAVAPMLVDMLTVLRSHRNLIVNLGLPWRGLYEYAGYLQALNNFRVLIGQWLLDGGPRSIDLLVSAEDFELVAWRTLGEGTLMIDMYEQVVSRQSDEPSTLFDPTQPQVERAVQWWKKLRR